MKNLAIIHSMTQKSFSTFTWILTITAILLPLFAWGGSISWNIGTISGLQWFPLFGLLAWMIMWTHYITGAIRVGNPTLKKPSMYGGLTSWIVLGALLLHPIILTNTLKSNGAGSPPQSWTNYVGENLQLAVMLGSASLLIFLSFEVLNRLKNKDFIKKIWPLISISQSLAMILIFVHALQLGSDLTEGWFKIVWIICGLTLIPCFYIIHKSDFTK